LRRGGGFEAESAHYDGFVVGEDETVLAGSPIFGGDAVGAVDAGIYTITPSGLTFGGDGTEAGVYDPVTAGRLNATRAYSDQFVT